MTTTWESQLSIHLPSAFLLKHWQALLPQWHRPMESVLIYLQSSPVRLCDRTPETEAAKETLRHTFLKKAQAWSDQITQQGYLAEPFDPKFGTPIYSGAGAWTLDDVAVAHTLLQLPVFEHGGCKLLRHPEWKTAVFPSTLLSSASPQRLRQIIT